MKPLAEATTEITARDAAKAHALTVHVAVRDLWRVRMGLRLIRFGAWLAGFGYREQP